jgi:hypothetical protein
MSSLFVQVVLLLLHLLITIIILPSTLSLTTITNNTTTTTITSYILRLGVFDWAGYDGTNDTYGGEDSIAVSAMFPLAIQHWNDRRVDLIPALSVVKQCNKNMTMMKFCDVGGDSLRAARDTIWMLQNYKIDAMLGYGGLDSSFTGSMIAEKFGIPTIDHWTSAVRVSDKHDFPMYARTIPSDIANADMIIQLIVQFKYKRVALLVMSDAQEFGQYMVLKLKSKQITAFLVSFSYGPSDNTIISAVNYLATLKLSVTVAATWLGNIPQIANAAAAATGNGDLLGMDKLWIFTYMSREPNPSDYINPNVTALFHGSLWIRPMLSNNPNWNNFISQWPKFNVDFINKQFPPYGLKNSAIECANSVLNMQLRPDFFAAGTVGKQTSIWTYVYDAVLAYGFAMCKNNLNGPIPDGLTLYSNILQNQFVGLSGTSLKFDSVGDRDPFTSGFSVTNWNKTVLSTVGIWSNTEQQFILQDNLIQFRNGPGLSNRPQFDIKPPNHEQNLIPSWAQILGYVETSLVFTCSLLSLFWLQWNANLYVVKYSQPLFMQIIIVGILCLGASIIPLTMEFNNDACMVFPWMVCIGLSLSVAPIAVKSVRVGVLWYNPGAQRKGQGNFNLYLSVIVGVLLVDFILLICWTVIDPLTYQRFIILSDIWENPIQSYGSCQGNSQASVGFLSALLVFNGLIALCTVGISVWVSNAPEKFHEARFTALAAVAIGQAFFFGIPVVAAVFLVPLARFLVLSSLCFITAMAVLGTMFLPKMLAGREEVLNTSKRGSQTNNNNSNDSPRRAAGQQPQQPQQVQTPNDNNNTLDESPRESPDTSHNVKDHHKAFRSEIEYNNNGGGGGADNNNGGSAGQDKFRVGRVVTNVMSNTTTVGGNKNNNNISGDDDPSLLSSPSSPQSPQSVNLLQVPGGGGGGGSGGGNTGTTATGYLVIV